MHKDHLEQRIEERKKREQQSDRIKPFTRKTDKPRCIDWNVQKYGTLVDDYETKQGGCFIRQKIYRLDDKHYLETWVNGYRVAFIELEVYR